MTGEENGVPNPKNLTAAARRILPRPFGVRAGRGRVPWTPGGTRKGAATLDAILHRGHRGRVSVRRTKPTSPQASQSGKASATRKGRDFVSPARSNHSHLVSSHLSIADSHLPVALTAPSAERLHCLPCWFVTARPGRTTTLFCKVQTIASYERVLFVSGPHRNTHHQPPNFQHRARPRSSSPIIGEIAHVQNHAWGRRFPPFGSFCHPLGEAFLALWGWGSPPCTFPAFTTHPFRGPNWKETMQTSRVAAFRRIRSE